MFSYDEGREVLSGKLGRGGEGGEKGKVVGCLREATYSDSGKIRERGEKIRH